MASNKQAMPFTADVPTEPHKTRRSSFALRRQSSKAMSSTVTDEQYRVRLGDEGAGDNIAVSISSDTVTPFLARHIPETYNPMNGSMNDNQPVAESNTKYCNRHRPDLKCRRQADEPSMEQLQMELATLSQNDQETISRVWSAFSASPAKQRTLMLRGILAVCCFPQLSFISASVRDLIKIDFLSLLPPELGFKILTYLDTTSLCKAAQVSRRWRTLADDDVVWHRMCEQHIDKRCTKCGWGLPLLEQRRLRMEKRQIQLRATGRVPDDEAIDVEEPEREEPAKDVTESTIAVIDIGIHSLHDHCINGTNGNGVSGVSELFGNSRTKDGVNGVNGPSNGHTNGVNGATSRAVTASPDSRGVKRPAEESLYETKRLCSYDRRADKKETKPTRRPWKDVYKARFKIGTNWKYGRCSIKILQGHTNGVMCLQFIGNTLATGSYDSTIKIWDIDAGTELRTLKGHTAGVRCLKFDDIKLVSGSLDCTIKMWNWKTGECLRTFEARAGVIGLNYESKYLCAGSMDNAVRVWNTTDKITFSLQGHTDFVNSVKVDAASRTVFSASDDCTVRLWDLDTRKTLMVYEGHVGQVQQVLPLPVEFQFDEKDIPDGDTDTDHDLELDTYEDPHSPASARDATPPLANTSLFPCDASRPNPPQYMLTGALDSTIRLWHVPSGRCLRTFFGHLEGIWALAADTLRVVSGAEDRMVKVWDPQTGKCERTFTGHAGPVTCIALDGERLISGGEDCEVRVLEFGSS
ncbi:WD40 repeat-like protein [Trichodelitschia bisporula]|uniref:WD40 repeat-like protein n=1 Tax=Trichodelitschia bisporula TaxID=703511 RepID=A0A6G1I4X5_9PEZI|nr:WD40 repeat-like protein [Trichodelitschia bisporula]